MLSSSTGTHARMAWGTVNDGQLLSMVAAGDESAFEELYERYATAVMSFAFRRVNDREVAREVADDVWLACWRSAGSFRGDGEVLSWLLGIAKRQVYMRWRGKHPETDERGANVLETLPDDVPGPEEQTLSMYSVNELCNQLRTLPVDILETVTLAWLHELPYAHIAELQGIPVGTVKSRIWHARKMLYQQIQGSMGKENES